MLSFKLRQLLDGSGLPEPEEALGGSTAIWPSPVTPGARVTAQWTGGERAGWSITEVPVGARAHGDEEIAQTWPSHSEFCSRDRAKTLAHLRQYLGGGHSVPRRDAFGTPVPETTAA